jgi:hypothetical protein
MTKMTPALQNSTPDKFWKSRFRELRKFKAKHGHTKLSSSKVSAGEDNVQLFKKLCMCDV